MKIILFLSVFLFALKINAQQDTLIAYSDIVQTDSIGQNQLFINARDWFNKTFNSSKDVLQIIDKENGQLSGKGILGGTFTVKYWGDYTSPIDCSFSIDIKVKEGKYKYSFTNFIPKGDSRNVSSYFPTLTSSSTCPTKLPNLSQERTDRYWVIYKDAVNERMLEVINSLKISMVFESDDGF